MTVSIYGNYGPGIRANDVCTARLLRMGFGDVSGETFDLVDTFDYPDGPFETEADPPWRGYTTCTENGDILNGKLVWNSVNARTMYRNFDNMSDVQDIFVEMVLDSIVHTGVFGGPRPTGGPACRCRNGSNVTGSYQAQLRYNGTQLPNQVRIIRQGVTASTCPSDNVLTTVNLGGPISTGRVAIQAVGVSPTSLTAFFNGVSISSTTDSEAEIQQARRAGWVWNGVTSTGGLLGNILNWSEWRCNFL